METKNEILATLFKELAGTKSTTGQSIQRTLQISSDSIGPAIGIIQRELEDDQLLNEIKKINSATGSLPYNPFAIEYLLNDTVELLKSCIQKRTELKNLEVTMLTDCINKIMAEKGRAFQNKIIEIEEAYPESVKTLNKQTKLKTTVDHVEADEDSVKNLSKFEDSIKIATKELKEQGEKFENLLNVFSKDKNSGLNYTARYIELKEIYWEDFKEVFRKLKCLEIGFNSIYEMNTLLPSPDESNLLNKYYLWLKENLLKLNKLLDREQEYTLVVSIMKGTAVTPTNGVTEVLILPKGENTSKYAKEINWAELLEQGSFQFDIMWVQQEENPFYMKKHRLKNVSIQLSGVSNENYWNVMLRPPYSKDSLGNNYFPPFLSCLCSGSRQSSLENQTKNLSYINTDPYNNWWDLRISSTSMKRNTITEKKYREFGVPHDYLVPYVEDILIFMRVAVIN